uniref:Uncharacterized protein n=1 Tax=Cacopsylla melanoneura TaxID=428564 RepID=A0A8D8WTS6_9HEMI
MFISKSSFSTGKSFLLQNQKSSHKNRHTICNGSLWDSSNGKKETPRRLVGVSVEGGYKVKHFEDDYHLHIRILQVVVYAIFLETLSWHVIGCCEKIFSAR